MQQFCCYIYRCEGIAGIFDLIKYSAWARHVRDAKVTDTNWQVICQFDSPFSNCISISSMTMQYTINAKFSQEFSGQYP